MSYFKNRKAAFRYAGKGVCKLFRHEAHAKIHLLAAIAVIACAIIWHITPVEWCLCILCIAAVFAAEAVNTAIEKLADKVSKEKDPLIATAKDVAAAAVLILAVASAAVGLIIFLPYWLR